LRSDGESKADGDVLSDVFTVPLAARCWSCY